MHTFFLKRWSTLRWRRHLNRYVGRVCCKSARHWLTAAPTPPSNCTQITDGCGVGQLLCFRCIQAITADTVIACITHDDRPNISSASSGHGAKRRDVAACNNAKLKQCVTLVAIGELGRDVQTLELHCGDVAAGSSEFIHYHQPASAAAAAAARFTVASSASRDNPPLMRWFIRAETLISAAKLSQAESAARRKVPVNGSWSVGAIAHFPVQKISGGYIPPPLDAIYYCRMNTRENFLANVL